MRVFVFIGLSIAFLFGLARAATVTVDGASVVVNGVRVLTLRTTSGNMGPKARAKMLASNIEKVSKEGNVEVKKVKKTHLVYLDGKLILTVTKEEEGEAPHPFR